MNTPQKRRPEDQKAVYNRKRARVLKKRKLKRNVTLFVLLYAVMMVCICAIVLISLHTKSPTRKNETYSLKVITDTEEKNVEYKSDELYFDKEFYIPLSAIEKLCPVTSIGHDDTIGFIFKNNGENAKFVKNTAKGYVNGNEIDLSGNVIYKDGELYLPPDFFTTHIVGFNLEINDKEKTYTLSKIDGVDPSFLLKNPSSTDNQSEKDQSEATASPLVFKADLSSYEEYMNPENRDEYLFLVNTENPLDENYVPTDLLGSIYTRDDGRATQKLRKYACLALEAFLKEAEACGIKGVTVTSGYRSYEYQSQLFQNEINIMGSFDEAAKNVNPPGSSEHQSGLCVDMHNLSSASTAFAKTEEAEWLKENAYKFGYILRYPKDKTDITGISFEPWHFRYVGRYHATKMHEYKMCLEEYIEYINK